MSHWLIDIVWTIVMLFALFIVLIILYVLVFNRDINEVYEAVAKLYPNACAAVIVQYLKAQHQKRYTLGAVYAYLECLEDLGEVASYHKIVNSKKDAEKTAVEKHRESRRLYFRIIARRGQGTKHKQKQKSNKHSTAEVPA